MNEYSEDPGLKTYPNGYTFSRGQMVKAIAVYLPLYLTLNSPGVINAYFLNARM